MKETIRHIAYNSSSSASRVAVGRLKPNVLAPVARLMPLLISVLIGAIGTAAFTSVMAGGKRWVEGQILVKARPGLSHGNFDNLLKAHGARTKTRIDGIGVHVIAVNPNEEEALVRALSQDPRVAFAELDEYVELTQVETPNDTYYSTAWHLPMIDAPTAWQSSRGDAIIVAVLDTGVDGQHPDLSAKLVLGRNVAPGTANPANTSDINGHGTMTAGVVAAESNNAIGVASVAMDAAIMPVRVTDNPTGGASSSAIAAGLDWAINNGARVANISYQLIGSSTLREAAQRMRNAGGVVISAAGNDGMDYGYADNPALINVAATTSDDLAADYSSFGEYVDVAAPGSGIWTTYMGGRYVTASGTSFASPVAAGVAALILSANPDLTAIETEQVLLASADDQGAVGWDPHFGNGRVNAASAVAMALAAAPVDATPPSAAIAAPRGADTVTGLVPVEVSATDDSAEVRKVALYANGTLVGSDITAPYQFTWDSTLVADGPAQLIAYAYDAAGNEGVSGGVTVTVDNVLEPVDSEAPRASFVSPRNGEKVRSNVRIAATAIDNVGIAWMGVYVDRTQVCAGSVNTMRCIWDARPEAPGPHAISVVARDAAGNEATEAITVYR